MQTFKKTHRRKHEKSQRVFSSFAYLWRHTISRRPRSHAYQKPSGVIGAFEKEKNRVNLVLRPIFKLFSWTLRHVLGRWKSRILTLCCGDFVFLFVSFFVPYINVFCYIPHAFFYSLLICILYGIYLLSFHVHLVLVYRSCSVGSLNPISSIW